METKNVLFELRTKRGLSQEELAERLFVTRQAVSRWENGDTVPNTEALKLLSKFFDVSINTLLGTPRALVCECCGMPLQDSDISREKNGEMNEEYCKWCYSDGEYTMDFWKQYKDTDVKEGFEKFKSDIVREFNTLLRIENLPEVRDLCVLPGEFINMEYDLPGGERVKFLDDNATYLGSQLEGDEGKCYGIAANMDFLLICSYGENGKDPELIIYKKRKH